MSDWSSDVCSSDLILIIAKMAVVGMAPDRIAETLGSSKVEVEEILESQDNKDVRLLVGVEHARLSASKDFTWDLIEATALEGLSKRAGLEKYKDTLLRIAAVAHKAQRRMTQQEEHVHDTASEVDRVHWTSVRRAWARGGECKRRIA